MKNTQLTLGDVLRPLIDFFKKLLSKDGSQWLSAFKRFLRKEDQWLNVPIGDSWLTWKTIKLDTGLKTAYDFRKAIKDSGQAINHCGNDILGKSAFTVANQETEVELVKATAKELTGKDQATYQEICQRAEERGWKKCPNEVGPQLRLQYQDQPYDEWLVIAMEPITDSVGDLMLFCVKRDESDRWLGGSYGSPKGVWGGDDQFVFRKPACR